MRGRERGGFGEEISTVCSNYLSLFNNSSAASAVPTPANTLQCGIHSSTFGNPSTLSSGAKCGKLERMVACKDLKTFEEPEGERCRPSERSEMVKASGPAHKSTSGKFLSAAATATR